MLVIAGRVHGEHVLFGLYANVLSCLRGYTILHPGYFKQLLEVLAIPDESKFTNENLLKNEKTSHPGHAMPFTKCWSANH